MLIRAREQLVRLSYDCTTPLVIGDELLFDFCFFFCYPYFSQSRYEYKSKGSLVPISCLLRNAVVPPNTEMIMQW